MQRILDDIINELHIHDSENVNEATHLLITEPCLFQVLREYSCEFDFDLPSRRLLEQVMGVSIILVEENGKSKGYQLLKAIKGRVSGSLPEE